MALSKAKKRWLKISGIIVLVLFILLISLNSILSYKADLFLREKLSDIDTTSYHIDYEKIRVNVFSLTVKIYNISVKPSQSAMEEVKRSPLANPVVEASISRIKVGNVSIMKAVNGEAFNIGSLVLSQPEITVFSPQGIFPDKQVSNSGTSIFSSDSAVESPVKEASLGTFEIRDATLRWMDMSTEKLVLETRNLNIKAEDIWLHHPDGDTLSHVLDLEEISISLQSHMMKLPGDLYTLQTGQIGIGYKDKQLSLDSLKLIPTYSEARFGEVVGKQTDRFDVTVPNILITGIEFDSLVNKKVIIEKLSLTSPTAEMYRDKRIPRDMTIFPKLFQTSVALIPIYVNINEVEVSNGFINYQERLEGASEAGQVIFEQFDIIITGISNDAELISKGHAMKVDGKAMLMGKAPLTIHMDLPVGNNKEEFSYYGTIGKIDFIYMNPMIEHMVFVTAEKGTIKSAKFYARAKKDTIFGRIEFLYNDLKLNVIRKQKESSQGEIKNNRFFSAIAGAVMIKNNPVSNKPVRMCKMFFVRDPNKGFFNYIWKAIQSGIIHTLISGKKKQFSDMEWPEFEANWKQILNNDRKLFNDQSAKKHK